MSSRSKALSWLVVLLGMAATAWAYWGHTAPKETKPHGADGLEAAARSAGSRDTLCTSASPVGIGLRGEYFSGTGLSGRRLLSRVDPMVDVDFAQWPTGSQERPLSARWSGWIKAPVSGRYRFHVVPEGAKLTVSRQLLTGSPSAHSAPDSIELVAGRHYPVVVEFSGSGGRVQLSWTLPHGARAVIPRVFLNLPSDSV
jgi:beta-glucosidase